MTGRHDPVFQRQMFQLIWLEQWIFGQRNALARDLTGVSCHAGCRRIDMCVKFSRVAP